MAARIDFNCDMGEGFGAWRLGYDEQVIRYITSANVACGFHAGDPAHMRKTVRLAESHGVGIGAHPGFPDLRGFGRRNMNALPEEVKDDLVYQIGALTAFTRAKRLQHVKPHGALYNMAVGGGDLARAICETVLETDPQMILVVLAGSKWAEIAEAMAILERTGAQDYTRSAARRWRDEAIAQLDAAGVVQPEARAKLEQIMRSVISA